MRPKNMEGHAPFGKQLLEIHTPPCLEGRVHFQYKNMLRNLAQQVCGQERYTRLWSYNCALSGHFTRTAAAASPAPVEDGRGRGGQT